MNSEHIMCRICLTASEDYDLISIFGENTTIAKNIFLISGTKIIESRQSNIEALICSDCIKELQIATEFRQKCLEADDYFRQYIPQTQSLLWNQKDSINDNKMSLNEEICMFSSNSFDNADENVTEEDSLDFKKEPQSDIIEESPRKYKIKQETVQKEITQDEAYCQLCSKSFSTIHSYNDHMRAIHENLNEEDMFKCPQCSRLFKMKYYLNRHIKNAHNKSPVKKQSKQSTVDEIFKEKLSGVKCPYCSKYLTSRHSLHDHIRVKHAFIDYSDRFFCDMCGKDFPLKYYLLRHIKAAHLKTLSYKKKNNENLPCSICGKILKSKGNLTTHEKTHRILTPAEYYYCDLCGNKFKGRGEMSVHIKQRHLYKVKYPCELCPGKSWRTLFQLQRHVKVFHNKIREFKCEWCGKDFGEKNKLICHTRIHTGERPFHCTWENCNRTFTHQTDLRRHFWGHTGERPYKCEFVKCQKGFMKKSELLAHENRCHSHSMQYHLI